MKIGEYLLGSLVALTIVPMILAGTLFGIVEL
jgi:hypothetical protein